MGEPVCLPITASSREPGDRVKYTSRVCAMQGCGKLFYANDARHVRLPSSRILPADFSVLVFSLRAANQGRVERPGRETSMVVDRARMILRLSKLRWTGRTRAFRFACRRSGRQTGCTASPRHIFGSEGTRTHYLNTCPAPMVLGPGGNRTRDLCFAKAAFCP